MAAMGSNAVASRLVDKEELRNYEGILDDRFQDNFRVRCAFCGKVGDISWADEEMGFIIFINLVGGDWNHGILWSPIQLGMESSQLTNSYFSEG